MQVLGFLFYKNLLKNDIISSNVKIDLLICHKLPYDSYLEVVIIKKNKGKAISENYKVRVW